MKFKSLLNLLLLISVICSFNVTVAIVLNGADNVTIDGLNAGGNAIEFRNSGIGVQMQ